MTELYLLKSALRDLIRTKRLITAGLLMVFPALLALLWRFGAQEEFDSYVAYNTLMSVLVYGFLLVILSVIFGTGVISQEIEQKTITYLLTRPVPRWRIAMVKFAAAWVGITVTVVVSTLLLAGASFGMGAQNVSQVLTLGDVSDPQALMRILKEHPDDVSKYIWEKLPARRQSRLQTMSEERQKDVRTQRAFLRDLSNVLRSDSGFYEEKRFSGFDVPADLKALALTRPTGRELKKLNHRLLETCYPECIKPQSEPTFPLAKDLITLPIGALAYGSLFMLLATLFARPLMFGLVFAFGWESWVPNFPGSFSLLSIMSYLRVLVPHPQQPGESVDLMQMMTGASTSSITMQSAQITLAGVILVSLALSLYLFSTREYVPRDDVDA